MVIVRDVVKNSDYHVMPLIKKITQFNLIAKVKRHY